MIYNEHTISIERFSMVYKTGRLSLLSAGGMVPGFLLRGRFAAILKFLNELLGADDPDMLKDVVKLRMSNLINVMLPSLYNGLLTGPTKEMIEWYKAYFGKAPETSEDIQRVLSEQKKQAKMYKALYPEEKIEHDTPFDFDAFVNGLEFTRGIQIDRKDKLYTLKAHYSNAVEINRLRQKVKKNG